MSNVSHQVDQKLLAESLTFDPPVLVSTYFKEENSKVKMEPMDFIRLVKSKSGSSVVQSVLLRFQKNVPAYNLVDVSCDAY